MEEWHSDLAQELGLVVLVLVVDRDVEGGVDVLHLVQEENRGKIPYTGDTKSLDVSG